MAAYPQRVATLALLASYTAATCAATRAFFCDEVGYVYEWNAASADVAATITLPQGVVPSVVVPGDNPSTGRLLICRAGNDAAAYYKEFQGQGIATSVSASISAADAAAVSAGVPLVIDSAVTLSAPLTLSASLIVFRLNGSISRGAYALTINGYVDVPTYAYVFIHGAGLLTFSKPATFNPCWFGANWQGSTVLADEVATTKAFITIAKATYTAGYGSICEPPPGYYIFAAGTDQTNSGQWFNVMSTGLRFKAKAPHSVRFSLDPTTIPPNTGGYSYRSQGLFIAGNPLTLGVCGAKNPSFIGGTYAAATGCYFIGAFDPARIENGFVWENIDVVYDCTAQSGTFLGANIFCIFIYRFASYNFLIANSDFSGLPNDAVNIIGSGDVVGCNFSRNGFYSGAAEGDTTRNGATFAGWQDVLNVELTSDHIHIRDCSFIGNCDTGCATGGMCNDALVDGCTTTGNGNTAYEFILFGGEKITQWQQSVQVAVNNLMYVPGTSSAPPNLGGFVFQCTAVSTGITNSTGTGPTGSVGNTGISDGGVTWQCIGYMPANGMLACQYSLCNTVDDGAIPAKINVPWIGSVSAMTHIIGNGINCACHFVVNSGNEKRLTIRNVVARNFGYASSVDVASFSSNNGGVVDIDGYELDNCYGPSGSGGILNIYAGCQHLWGYGFFGTQANNKARVRLRNIRFRNSIVQAAATSAIFLQGNFNSVEISGIDADNTVWSYATTMYMSYSAACVAESFRMRGCRINGALINAAQILWKYDSSVLGGMDFEDNEFFNMAISGTLASTIGYSVLTLSGSGGTKSISTVVRFNGNRLTYGGVGVFPIGVNAATAGLMSLQARGNFLIGGPYFPTSSTLVSNSAAFLTIDAGHNGLAGDRQVMGSATPTVGTWYVGDTQWRSNAAASGVSYETCTRSATITGFMSNCAVTIANGTKVGTYTGTPPAPGEYITFASGPTGTYQVCYANNGNIGLTASANNNASGVTLSYYTSVHFASVSLSA